MRSCLCVCFSPVASSALHVRGRLSLRAESTAVEETLFLVRTPCCTNPTPKPYVIGWVPCPHPVKRTDGCGRRDRPMGLDFFLSVALGGRSSGGAVRRAKGRKKWRTREPPVRSFACLSNSRGAPAMVAGGRGARRTRTARTTTTGRRGGGWSSSGKSTMRWVRGLFEQWEKHDEVGARAGRAVGKARWGGREGGARVRCSGAGSFWILRVVGAGGVVFGLL